MTCIVAVECAGHIHMAGDSAISHDVDTVVGMTLRKVRAVHGLAIGGAGDLRGLNLVMTWCPPVPPAEHIYPWLVREFVPALQRDLVDQTTIGEPPDIDLLVGVSGGLWHVASDGAVHDCDEPVAALGSASDLALGVLRRGGQSTPKRRLVAALEAAEGGSTFCRRPWTFVRV